MNRKKSKDSMLKRYFLLLLLLISIPFLSGFSQILEPVKWKMSAEKISDVEYILIFEAAIDDEWHLYAQHIDDGGPIPTSFTFDSTATFKLIGETEEDGDSEEAFDSIFGMDVKWFVSHAIFRQKLKLADPGIVVHGVMEFMACDDKQCIPPETIEFTADLASNELQLGAEEEFEPIVQDNSFGEPYRNCKEKEAEEEEKKGLIGIFLLGFIGGLIAFVTPCVFPMVPLTVSFFTKKSSRRKGLIDAFLFGFCIVLIYFLLSIPFFLLDLSPDVLNEIATGAPLNVIFFAIFMVFAISFFGYFELTLPSSWTTKADTASNVGGILGIFFMALTLALVSFSCTGPILGSLLVSTLQVDGGNVNLMVGMTGFGLALAFPFTLFAIFPRWLESLPKSGGWMNTIKVILGFIEVGLALKFLSNADMVKQWGLLKREIFLGLWILTSLGLGLYLFGLIKFPHDSSKIKLSWGRVGVGIIAIGFAIYMIPGLWGKNLRLISGIPPPMFYSILSESTCPLNLNCYHDFDEGMAFAKEQNKPVIIDFTGWACANCRRMEENVWPEDKVYSRLMNDFVLISLYVDEKEKLLEEEQYISEFSGKKVVTIGNKWADFQAANFGSNSQPWYVLLSPEGRLLNEPVGNTQIVSEYVHFLDCGYEAFLELQGATGNTE